MHTPNDPTNEAREALAAILRYDGLPTDIVNMPNLVAFGEITPLVRKALNIADSAARDVTVAALLAYEAFVHEYEDQEGETAHEAALVGMLARLEARRANLALYEARRRISRHDI
ncbi:hypothetical protein ABZ815_20350 [Nonomuraea sp. NPDC047529]|uniref:hypothetical protein n=1 Tax=Nonomuraea sp. NPDC047529 TaxID=3155623 RepID=UPI0033E64012